MTEFKYPRYQFHSERATAYPDGTYAVDARTDRGWDITWYIQRGDDGQWVIYTYKPSNEQRYIKPTGSLGKRILARVNKTISAAQAPGFGDQAVDKVQ